MQKAINKGFTLIELLVVIAIIGILASIVLVSLGNARSKGGDAAVQGNLGTIRTQSELVAAGYGTQAAVAAAPGSSCGTGGMWTDTTIAAATKAAGSSAGVATAITGIYAVGQSIACYSSASGWWAAALLKTDLTKAWCVDSNGKTGSVTATGITSGITACP